MICVYCSDCYNRTFDWEVILILINYQSFYETSLFLFQIYSIIKPYFMANYTSKVSSQGVSYWQDIKLILLNGKIESMNFTFLFELFLIDYLFYFSLEVIGLDNFFSFNKLKLFEFLIQLPGTLEKILFGLFKFLFFLLLLIWYSINLLFQLSYLINQVIINKMISLNWWNRRLIFLFE